MKRQLTPGPGSPPYPALHLGAKLVGGGGGGGQSVLQDHVPGFLHPGHTGTEASTPRAVTSGRRYDLSHYTAWERTTQKRALEILLKCSRMMQNTHAVDLSHPEFLLRPVPLVRWDQSLIKQVPTRSACPGVLKTTSRVFRNLSYAGSRRAPAKPGIKIPLCFKG